MAKAKAAPAAQKKTVVEKPLTRAEATQTAQEERYENNPEGTRVDGTTARHTEPLGPPAPGQQGRPGPERRVTPQNQNPGPRRAEQPKVDRGPKIRVTATRIGYLNDVRRRAGDVFDIYADQFSEKWMEAVDGSTPKKATGAQAALEANRQGRLAETIARKSGGSVAKRDTDDSVID